jgi:alcohol dehydrogenase
MPGIFNVRIPDTTIGLGAINTIGDAAKSFAPAKILIITDAGLVKAGVLDAVRSSLEKAGLKFDVDDGCQEKPPIGLLDKLARKVKAGRYDLLIGVGGGSVMDSTKIVSVVALNNMSVLEYVKPLFRDRIEGKIIPTILVPTTAGTGSEWSQIAVVYEDEPGRRLYPSNSCNNIAAKVIIDPALTVSLPQRITADTGIDALTHAIEVYTSGNPNVLSDMFASTAIKLVADNIRLAYAKGRQSIEARYHMSVAAALAMGSAMFNAGPGLVHLIQDPIQVHFSHGVICGVLLPATMEYNLVAIPARFAMIAELMGENISGLSVMDAAAKSVEAVRRLIRDMGLPRRLSDIGVTEADIPGLARQADAINREAIAILSPRDASAEDIAQILRSAL